MVFESVALRSSADHACTLSEMVDPGAAPPALIVAELPDWPFDHWIAVGVNPLAETV